MILGGGVRKGGRLGEEGFFRQIRERLQATLNGYIIAPALGSDIDRYLVPPLLGDDAGVCGAMALGRSMASDPVNQEDP